MDALQQLWLLLDISIAACLGGVLGFERESKDKPAGFRTNMVIAGSSALLLILGQIIATQMTASIPGQALSIDPTRIIHAIILGVGFIGAGTIWKGNESTSIKNLTTASMLLFSVGIGIAVALKLYIMAIGVTILSLVISHLVSRFSKSTR